MSTMATEEDLLAVYMGMIFFSSKIGLDIHYQRVSDHISGLNSITGTSFDSVAVRCNTLRSL